MPEWLNALIPGNGGCYFLPRIVGMANALELLWTSRSFTAEEARWVAPLCDALAEAAPLLVTDDPNGFMSKVALILNPPAPKPPREKPPEPRAE